VGDTEQHPLIGYLEGLADDRSALAALRRGLGQPPGTVASMYPYIARWINDRTPLWQEKAYYLIASLYAWHPQPGGAGNMGDHFRLATGNRRQAMERRFVALLATHPDDLPDVLRQAVSLIRSREVPINWDQLLWDVLHWSHPDRYVQRRWAGQFWQPEETQSSETSE